MADVGRRAGLLYPVLFAAALVLGIAAASAGQYRGSDLAVVLSVVVLATALFVALVVVVARLVDRSPRAEPLAAALAMLAVAWFFFYVPAQNALAEVTYRFSRDRVLVPLGAVATVAAVVWLLRQPAARLAALGRFMTRFAVLLVVIIAAQALLAQGRGSAAARRSALVRQLSAPVRTAGPVPASRNTPQRDIYLIVLDGHANGAVLREVLGYDNSAFEDSLRALGFVIPPGMRSNYTQTVLSLPSLLNAAHVTQLTQDAGETNTDYSLPKHLVGNNRVARFLKQHGYKYVLFPSAWWGITEHSPLADQEFDARPEFSLEDEARATELRLAVLRSTLLRNSLRHERADAAYYRRSFEGMRAVARDPRPTFVFSHVLLPHIPYFFDERCQPLDRPITAAMEADTPAQRAAYIAQVKCVDGLTLALVTDLLRDSPTPPVILVVGDHGSRFTDVQYYKRPDRVTPAFIRERFGALGAFYLPAGGDSVVGEPITLVNVLGNVLRYYFNADLPPSPDDMYVSGERPYRFYKVDAGVGAPP
jgi:Sulfatase